LQIIFFSKVHRSPGKRTACNYTGMTEKERDRLNWLCQQIPEEHEHDKLMDLVSELTQLLEERQRQFALVQSQTIQ
jgi:hypothetical protein